MQYNYKLMSHNNQISDRGGVFTFTKYFNDKLDFDREKKGYEFISSFYTKIPKILESNDGDEPSIKYERVDMVRSRLVADMLYDGNLVDLREVFASLSLISNKYYQKRESTGGTQVFYVNRTGKLVNRQMTNRYVEYLKSSPPLMINGQNVPVEKDLLQRLRERINSFQDGICIPSQGDLHERNLFTNGYIIDFEGAGWNHVATDLATFLWHTMFAGNYFGPQYAKWSTTVDKKRYREQEPQIASNKYEITLRLSKARSYLLSQYLGTYVNSLVFLDDQILNDVCNAIAFRLVSTFSPLAMNNRDRAIAFAMANLFYNADLNLYDKMKILINKK